MTGEYDYTLPSLDFDIDVMEDVKLRASYSETIARPSWADMQGGVALATLFRVNEGSGSSGNPICCLMNRKISMCQPSGIMTM